MKNLKENSKIKKKGGFLGYLIILLILLLGILAYLLLKTKGQDYFNESSNLFGPYLNFFENALLVLILFFVAYFFIKITKRAIRNYLERVGRSKKNIKLFLNIYGFFIWIIIIFLTMSLIFKEVGSLITSIGLIGFGLTLALQKPILNFIGWITIIFGKTYQIGDIISINNSTGKVYDLSVMHTHISELNPDGDSTGKSITLPNEFVFIHSVKNFSKGTDYVWDDIVINITYKSNWRKAIKIVENIVQEYYNKNIKKEIKEAFIEDFKKYEKVIVRFGMYEKGIYIKVRYMVNFNRANEVKRELTEIILNRLKTRDISFGKTESVG